MSHKLVADNETIIRRVPPSGAELQTAMRRPDGSYRPTSASLGLRDNEVGLSCSQQSITSPKALLGQLDRSVDGWMVAAWKVADLPSELEVVVTPSDPPELDPGHCEIRPKTGKSYSSKLQSKLARAGTIIFGAPGSS